MAEYGSSIDGFVSPPGRAWDDLSVAVEGLERFDDDVVSPADFDKIGRVSRAGRRAAQTPNREPRGEPWELGTQASRPALVARGGRDGGVGVGVDAHIEDAARAVLRTFPEERTDADCKLVWRWIRRQNAACRRYLAPPSVSTGGRAVLCRGLKLLSLPRGTLVYRQGDTGDSFFVVLRGAVEVYYAHEADDAPDAVGRTGHDGAVVDAADCAHLGVRVGVLPAGEGFGEPEEATGTAGRSRRGGDPPAAAGTARRCTVVSVGDGAAGGAPAELLQLPRKAFATVVAPVFAGVAAARASRARLLRRFRLFEGWSPGDVAFLSYWLVERTVAPGALLHHAGSKADHVCFVLRGSVHLCVARGPTRDGSAMAVSTIESVRAPGVFGVVEAVRGMPRFKFRAQVPATGERAVVASVPAAVFKRLCLGGDDVGSSPTAASTATQATAARAEELVFSKELWHKARLAEMEGDDDDGAAEAEVQLQYALMEAIQARVVRPYVLERGSDGSDDSGDSGDGGGYDRPQRGNGGAAAVPVRSGGARAGHVFHTIGASLRGLDDPVSPTPLISAAHASGRATPSRRTSSFARGGLGSAGGLDGGGRVSFTTPDEDGSDAAVALRSPRRTSYTDARSASIRDGAVDAPVAGRRLLLATLLHCTPGVLTRRAPICVADRSDHFATNRTGGSSGRAVRFREHAADAAAQSTVERPVVETGAFDSEVVLAGPTSPMGDDWNRSPQRPPTREAVLLAGATTELQAAMKAVRAFKHLLVTRTSNHPSRAMRAAAAERSIAAAREARAEVAHAAAARARMRGHGDGDDAGNAGSTGVVLSGSLPRRSRTPRKALPLASDTGRVVLGFPASHNASVHGKARTRPADRRRAPAHAATTTSTGVGPTLDEGDDEPFELPISPRGQGRTRGRRRGIAAHGIGDQKADGGRTGSADHTGLTSNVGVRQAAHRLSSSNYGLMERAALHRRRVDEYVASMDNLEASTFSLRSRSPTMDRPHTAEGRYSTRTSHSERSVEQRRARGVRRSLAGSGIKPRMRSRSPSPQAVGIARRRPVSQHGRRPPGVATIIHHRPPTAPAVQSHQTRGRLDVSMEGLGGGHLG